MIHFLEGLDVVVAGAALLVKSLSTGESCLLKVEQNGMTAEATRKSR